MNIYELCATPEPVFKEFMIWRGSYLRLTAAVRMAIGNSDWKVLNIKTTQPHNGRVVVTFSDEKEPQHRVPVDCETPMEHFALKGFLMRTIWPQDKSVVVDGKQVEPRHPCRELRMALRDHAPMHHYLSTWVAVDVFEPVGDHAAIYEKGVPVVEIGGLWDIDIPRRLPWADDNHPAVCPEFIRDVRGQLYYHDKSSVLGPTMQPKR